MPSRISGLDMRRSSCDEMIRHLTEFNAISRALERSVVSADGLLMRVSDVANGLFVNPDLEESVCLATS